MSFTSTSVKSRYNKKAYKQFNVQIKPQLYERIVNYCAEKQISRSEFLSLSIQLLEAAE